MVAPPVALDNVAVTVVRCRLRPVTSTTTFLLASPLAKASVWLAGTNFASPLVAKSTLCADELDVRDTTNVQSECGVCEPTGPATLNAEPELVAPGPHDVSTTPPMAST